MTRDELTQNNGKEGRPAHILYKGKIYDVSGSRLWKGGVHMARHKAGEDITAFLPVAPHGEEVLARVTLVGEMQESSSPEPVDIHQILRDLYRRYHPHPVMIHFPMGLFFFAALMQFLFLLTKSTSFEHAAFYALVTATAGAFPAAASGLFSWWINYDLTITTIFRNKLTFTGILLCMGVALVTIRFFMPDISFRSDAAAYIYHGFVFSTVPVVSLIGYNGGKITWPS